MTASSGRSMPSSVACAGLPPGPVAPYHPRPEDDPRPGTERPNEEEATTVPSVAIVTDSASDLPPDVAARDAIAVVPLVVSFGAESFRSGVNLSTDEFWVRMTSPDSPFPTT